MNVFRLTLRQFATPLSGKGSAAYGARWNSAGVELIYTAANRSLAMAEVLVHMAYETTPLDYVMVTIGVPVHFSIAVLGKNRLPPDWSEFPYNTSTPIIGDKFVADNRHCMLRVPSVVVAGDANLLINPHHPDFRKVKIVEIEDFRFDKRLVK